MALALQLINSTMRERPYLKNLQGLQIHMPRKHSDCGAAIWFIIMLKYVFIPLNKEQFVLQRNSYLGIWVRVWFDNLRDVLLNIFNKNTLIQLLNS